MAKKHSEEVVTTSLETEVTQTEVTSVESTKNVVETEKKEEILDVVNPVSQKPVTPLPNFKQLELTISKAEKIEIYRDGNMIYKGSGKGAKIKEGKLQLGSKVFPMRGLSIQIKA